MTIRSILAVFLLAGTAVAHPFHPIPVPPQPNTYGVLTAEASVGSSSIAIGADGLPIAAYGGNYGLKVVKCTSPTCETVGAPALVVPGVVLNWKQIVIGADSRPLIAYADDSALDVSVVRCGDVNCASPCGVGGTVCTRIQSEADYPSIAINADGNPVVGFLSLADGDQGLKVADCHNAACTSFSLHLLESGNTYYPSIALGMQGVPMIAYLSATNGLRVATCNTQSCGSASIVTVDANGGAQPSLVIGLDGRPTVSYLSNTAALKVAKCNSRTCNASSGYVVSTLDTSETFVDTDMTIGPEGFPLIAYTKLGGSLRVLRCEDPGCTSGNVYLIDPQGGAGSATIGWDGLPIISYSSSTADTLQSVKCANTFCIPHWTRR